GGGGAGGGGGRGGGEREAAGGGKKTLGPRRVGGRWQMEWEVSFVAVEGPPVRAAAVAAGRLELDDVGPQVGKHAAGDPAEPVRRVDDQDARQQHGATLSTRHARGRSASKTRVNALMTRASILFPTRSFYEGRWIAPQLGLARVAQCYAPQVGQARQ